MSNYTVDDLSRMEKKGWRMAESIGAGNVGLSAVARVTNQWIIT